METENSEKTLVINFKRNLIDDFLICGICQGYFNFAHTLVDCGHTFCRICIYNHFKKSKIPKCPQCDAPTEKNFSKSVRRDPYKQSLVDLIHPEYHEQDLQIIKRCRLLFPDFDIQAIKDELDSSNWDFYPKRKRKQILESKLKKSLNDTVMKVLGLTLDIFSKDILDDGKFNEMLQKKIEYDKNNKNLEEAKQNEKPEVFISLYPKTPEDFNIVGLKNVLSVSNKSVGVAQLKKFLFNHLVNKYKDKEAPYDKTKTTLEGVQNLNFYQQNRQNYPQKRGIQMILSWQKKQEEEVLKKEPSLFIMKLLLKIRLLLKLRHNQASNLQINVCH